MYELDRTDVDAARRLRHEQKLRRDVILTTNDQLLLVTTGKRTRGQCCVWWTNVKALDDLHRASLHGVLVKKYSARESCNRRAIMDSEDRVLRETKVEQQPASMTIFGNVCDAELTPHTRAEGFEIPSFEIY